MLAGAWVRPRCLEQRTETTIAAPRGVGQAFSAVVDERIPGLPKSSQCQPVPRLANDLLLVGDGQPAPEGYSPGEAAYARADAAWQATVTALAAGGRVRVSRDGGRSYPRSRERPLPTNSPAQPTAVRVYDEHGLARCLPADFDVARGGRAQVDRDLARLQALVERCGGRVITDRSPNGGAHLYVPWQQPVPFQQLRPLMQALAGLLPTLDVQPAVNVLSGCLRPPGSRHKSGGWQELTTPLNEARRIAQNGNPADVWQELQRQLTPPQAAANATPAPSPNNAAPAPTQPRDALDLALPTGAAGAAGPYERRAHRECIPVARRRALSAETLRIAQHAEYDQNRYATPSQARQRVLAAAAGAGWSYSELLEQLHAGRWPGLTALYSRYRPRDRAERLGADWCSAVTWLRDHPTPADIAPAFGHNSHTREPTTHRGQGQGAHTVTADAARQPAGARQSAGEYQFVRTWWNAARRLERARYTGRAGLTRRLLLRALANAAQKKGSRYLEFGCRSLSLAMGVDHSTTAAALRALRSEEDPLLVLLEDRRGVRGDLYELTVPTCVQDSIDRRAWPAGSIEAIHPVFRALGLPVAFLYEQLRTTARSSFDLADGALISHRAAQAALKLLSTHGLATRTSGGWVRATHSLDALARTLGVAELVETVHEAYRRQRQVWRALLQSYNTPPGHAPRSGPAAANPGGRTAGGAVNTPEPPAAPPETPLELLYRVLGAVPIEDSHGAAERRRSRPRTTDTAATAGGLADKR